jgi:hypothetical protein
MHVSVCVAVHVHTLVLMIVAEERLLMLIPNLSWVGPDISILAVVAKETSKWENTAGLIIKILKDYSYDLNLQWQSHRSLWEASDVA